MWLRESPAQDMSDLQVQRTVANLHSNLGAASVKRFQEDFISRVFESPTIFMGPRRGSLL